jgi:hypothetical protein
VRVTQSGLKWERDAYKNGKPHYVFPEPDLFAHLVDTYFENCNVYLPILHRPTLEQGILDGQHFSDEAFGGVVLLVCAIGARFSRDPRVQLPGTSAWHSAGWAYFSQVRFASKMMVSGSRLHDLQVTCVRLEHAGYPSRPPTDSASI